MPPKALSTGSLGEDQSEVVCPLPNQDGSQCRKKCLGEKRYRSMQEHIRRAHPNYYLPKLPATEESFQLMINTPPSARPPPTQNAQHSRNDSLVSEPDTYSSYYATEQPGILETAPSATGAAVALAQLQGWGSDYDDYSDEMNHGLPSIHDTLPPFQPTTRELLPSVLPSPSSRYTSLPPIHRRIKPDRKLSVGENARRGKHERDRSKDFSIKEFSRRLSEEGRKAMSAEPPTAAWMQGKRWEDLIEAATTATEADDDRDLTPMPQSPKFPLERNRNSTGAPAAGATSTDRLTASGGAQNRLSLPPGFRPHGLLQTTAHHQTFNASPLQKALTPPPHDTGQNPDDPEPFPSIESGTSGQNFHIPTTGLSASSNENTSPLRFHQHSQSSSFGSKADLLEIYCASCGRPVRLASAYACTECICGVCSDCVSAIVAGPVIAMQSVPQAMSMQMRRGCPRCGVMGGKWKRFQLDFR